jgi:hypothetical protein
MQDIIKVGSTPSNSFEMPFKAEQISDIEIIYVQSGKQKILKRKEDIELTDYLAKVRLSQEDTFALDTNLKVQIQSRIKDSKGNVVLSDILVVNVEDCLFKEAF